MNKTYEELQDELHICHEALAEAHEREQALAAHVERLTPILKDARLSLDHAKVFISSRQKMHEAGQEGHDESIACLVQALEDTPATTLTKRDLIKQAEALEDAAGEFEMHERARLVLGWKSEKIRQQAAAL